MSVQGLKEVRSAITAHQAATIKGLRVGLLRGGLFIQRESQKIVPVDTGALKASASTRAEGQGMDTQVIVSYGQDYAVFVHENLTAKHKPGKTAKYLERVVREKRKRITEIVIKGIEDNRI